MSDVIIAALITAGATVIGALIGFYGAHKKIKANTQTDISFLNENENFKDILCNARTCCMYTVNSYELLNELNLILERNQDICLNEVNILVRRKNDENRGDIDLLNNNIAMWKRLVDRGKIRRLLIIGYDHDPDHYYTILDDKVAFCGQVLFDKTKPTGTTIEYIPLVIRNNTEIGKNIIRNYQNHFNNVVENYKEKLTLYSSAL